MNPSNCAKMFQFRTKSSSYFSVVRTSPSPLGVYITQHLNIYPPDLRRIKVQFMR
jgi:hypothetical protein